ncbi:diguanylate cyclase domain-containing protein [Aliivibrio kagoshimensis]|uniref:diguanylate cyclase domain-containing protein n=1 Tax=Aliivibrio kagoshimensis TaxID=2910230 RepID=UPI003D0AF195
MFVLDNRTLLVVTALISIGSAIALLVLWHAQSKRNGAGYWASGMSCIAIASVLISTRGVLSDYLSLVTANSFYVLGFVLILRGVRVFTGKDPLLLIDYALTPVVAACFYYFSHVDQNLSIRVEILSASFVLTCGFIVFSLLQDKDAPWRTSSFAPVIVFSLFGLFHGMRGVITFIQPSDSPFMSPGLLTTFVFLSGIFIIGAIAISLTLLSYGVLESKLRIVSLAVEQSASSIIITDNKGLIDYVNPASSEKTGYHLDEIKGKNPRIFQSGETSVHEYSDLWKSISEGNTWRGEFHNRKKNGELYWEIASIAPVKQKNGQISHYVAVKEDITDLKEAKRRIDHLANHDGLTDLPNRKLAMERLVAALTAARCDQKQVAVMFVDLDGFKAVNDSHGHDAGDQLLKETAQRLKGCVRDIDTVSRIGGDEFLIILNNVVDKKAVIDVTERLIHSIASNHVIGKSEVTISASIGISLYPSDSEKPTELVNLADDAMYVVKRDGKNNYAFI